MTTIRHQVLVVDDDPNSRALMDLILTHHGYDVLLAADGDLGLQVARTYRPSLILLDLALPRRSGYEIYEELQADPDTNRLPIIILSAVPSPTDLALWQQSPGIVAAFGKPFEVGPLVEVIDTVLTADR